MRNTPEPWDDGPQYAGPQLALPPLTPVVKLLLKLNFGIFLAMFLLSLAGSWTRAIDDVLGLSPDLWRRWFPFVPVWQLGTYGFLHSVDRLEHIFWNMLQLYFFGTMLESLVGSRRFAVVYFGAMLAGAALQLTISLSTGSHVHVIGASGAVLGVVVAAAVLRPNMRVILLFFPILLKWLAIAVVAIDVFALLTSIRDGTSDGVAHWVHLGGAAFGGIVAWRGWIWRDPIQLFQAKRAIAREQRRVDDEQRVDELLAKIHREGIQSLSRRERDFLKRMSSKG